ncbi:MAG: SDR family oxidoreductase [Chlorobiaceae bacterium]|nr:SDR family oxidoreductase [Chlorobiaceae bacterium]
MKHIVMITGAGKGIGRAIALDFAKASRNIPEFEPLLVLVSRTLSDLESLASECTNLGTETVIHEADIAMTTQMDRIVAGTVERFGRIDCLVNNAGVGRFKDLGEFTMEDMHYTMSTNVKGTFFLTQSVFEIMRRQRSGHLFFITSVAAEKPFRSSALYCMSKFAQKGLVEVIRLHARECNVRVTNVMPGAVHTPMWGDVPDDMRRIMMLPEDISGPVVNTYLLPARTVTEELVFRPAGGDINE